MLPDLPQLKSQMRDVLMRYVQRRAHGQLGLFNEVPKHIIHEGNATRVIRANGEVEESDLMTASVQTEINEKDAQNLTHNERMRILNDLADRMAREMSTKLYAALGETLDKAGQTVDNKGRPFDAEAILSIFKKMDFEFDNQGQPSMPQISIGPESIEAAKKAISQLQTDPIFKNRFETLMVEKQADWRDREASRKLVG
jgi:hypothetical protein